MAEIHHTANSTYGMAPLMRIVLCQKYISRHGKGGGLSTLYANLATAFAQLGADVSLLTTTPRKETGLEGFVTIHTLTPLEDEIAYAEQVAASLREIPHDIVETPTWKTELSEYIRLPSSQRSAVVIRTELPLERLIPTHPALERERQIIRAADALIAVSPFVARCVAEEYGRETDATVLNGVDMSLFRRLPHVQPERHHCIWVGDYNPVKRLYLLEAIAREEPAIQHHIVLPRPQDPEQSEPYQRLQSLPNTQISQQLPQFELVQLYNRASVVLTTSRYEAFGLSLVEGLACGTPFLAPADLESVQHLMAGGRCGLEFSAAATAASLLRETDWSAMRGAALQLASEFQWETCARETLAVYQDVLQKRSRS